MMMELQMIMQTLLWIGLGLLAAWLVVRVLLAVTSFLLHLVWIVGLACFAIWAVVKFVH